MIFSTTRSADPYDMDIGNWITLLDPESGSNNDRAGLRIQYITFQESKLNICKSKQGYLVKFLYVLVYLLYVQEVMTLQKKYLIYLHQKWGFTIY